MCIRDRLKDVQFISNTNNKIQLQGTIDGIDTQNKIVYYPRSSNLKTIKSSEAKLSDITIITQPQDATYKLNATVGTPVSYTHLILTSSAVLRPMSIP